MRISSVTGFLVSLVFLHLFTSAGAAFAADQPISWEEGVEYSNPDDAHLQLNIARPKEGDGPFPAIVCIHGGGFRAGERSGWNDKCKKLAAHGYVAVTVTYRLAPKSQFPAAVNDVKAAVRFLRANAAKYKIDPDRIGAVGDSAGGHLALFLGVTGDVKRFDDPAGGNADQSSRVQCVVDYYGPSDFTKSYGKSVDAAEVLPLFFGGNLETKKKEHIIGSPLYWVTPTAAPTLILHGTKDQYVAFEQATWIYEKMKAAEVDTKLVPLENAKHGFQGADAELADKEMFEWFDKKLKAPTLK